MNWSRIFFYLIISVLLLVIDFYSWQSFRLIIANANQNAKRITTLIFWSVTVITFITFFASQLTDIAKWPQNFRTYLIAALVIFYICKLVIVFFLLMDDIFRLFRWTWVSYLDKTTTNNAVQIGRAKFLSQTGLLLSGGLMLTFFWGMIRNAYNYQIKKIKIALPNLPEAFDGLRIVQISDIHTGSFTRTEPLYHAVELINNQKADYIFFTGDMVNEQSSEAEPYIKIFKNIKASKGIFAILGNHDYGDYRTWSSPEAKTENMNLLYKVFDELGWTLLRNQHVLIGEPDEQIAIIGVENWSNSLRFPKYGKLNEAYQGTEQAKVKLLMSHDPSHWDTEVTNQYKDIDITLSGHTHGMQFGVEIPGFIKWSPVQMVYPHWAGLYQQGKQYLYVNRGLGFLGYPGRVGILPEITVIDLKRSSNNVTPEKSAS